MRVRFRREQSSGDWRVLVMLTTVDLEEVKCNG